MSVLSWGLSVSLLAPGKRVAVSGFWKAAPSLSDPTQLAPGSKEENGFPFPSRGQSRAFFLDPRGHFPNMPLAVSAHCLAKPLQRDVSQKQGSDPTPQVLLCDLGKEG